MPSGSFGRGLWSLFKRALIGPYHHPSVKHLPPPPTVATVGHVTRGRGSEHRISIFIPLAEE